jgi:hypothetical protein
MLKVPYNIRPRGYENQTRVMPYRIQESYIKQTLCDIFLRKFYILWTKAME